MKEKKPAGKMRERADKLKNKAKIVKELINNPLATQREIAKRAGKGLGTTNRVIKQLEQSGTKDERILGITETDIEIVKLAQIEIHRRLQDQEELKKMRTFEIAQTAEKSERRYQIFKGDGTDGSGGLKSISDINITIGN